MSPLYLRPIATTAVKTTSSVSAEQATGRARTVRDGGRRAVVLGAVLVAVHQVPEVAVPVVIGVIIDRAVAPATSASMPRWLAGRSPPCSSCLSAAGCTGLYVEERAVTRRHPLGAPAARPPGPRPGRRRRGRPARPGREPLDGRDHPHRRRRRRGDPRRRRGRPGVVAGAAVLLRHVGAARPRRRDRACPSCCSPCRPWPRRSSTRADAHQEAVGAASGVAADLLARAAGPQGPRRGARRPPPATAGPARTALDAGARRQPAARRPTPGSPSPSPARS